MVQETVVFLHANGQTPETWEPVIEALPSRLRGIALPIEGLTSGEIGRFDIDTAARGVVDSCKELGIDRMVLCGVSIGAMVATKVAQRSPGLVSGLILSGTQVYPNQIAMKLQSVVFRILPERVLASQGMTRATALGVSRAVAGIDFRADLTQISCKTLVACGSRDKPNMGATKEAAAGIPDAKLHVEQGVGHLWNATHPDRFARMVIDFVHGLPR
jgi:pimeloyl-ACP methyl ester carboxylesterase